MKIISATIIVLHGREQVYLCADLPGINFDVTNLCLDFSCPSGFGEEYVKKHFPNIPIRLIAIPEHKYNFYHKDEDGDEDDGHPIPPNI